MNKYDIYLIYRITNWQKWHLCVLRLRQKSSNSRHKASTAPNLPSCTNSFRVICPTSRSTFCTKWQMEMEIQNTLKRYSNGTVNECRLFHDHEHICSKWMKQCNMFLSFLKNGRGKKKGCSVCQSPAWEASRKLKRSRGSNLPWKRRFESESVGCAVYFATEKNQFPSALYPHIRQALTKSSDHSMKQENTANIGCLICLMLGSCPEMPRPEAQSCRHLEDTRQIRQWLHDGGKLWWRWT